MTTTVADAVAVDTTSRRWVVAMHEGGHVSAARAFDWRVNQTRIVGDVGGETETPNPILRTRVRRNHESALIYLAGPVTSEMHASGQIDPSADYRSRESTMRALDAAGLPYGCESDMGWAVKLLGDDEVVLEQALVETRLVVRRKWIEIQRVARVLYLRGDLDAREIRKAAAW